MCCYLPRHLFFVHCSVSSAAGRSVLVHRVHFATPLVPSSHSMNHAGYMEPNVIVFSGMAPLMMIRCIVRGDSVTLLASTSFDYQLCTPTQKWAGTSVSPGQPTPKDDVNVFGSEEGLTWYGFVALVTLWD